MSDPHPHTLASMFPMIEGAELQELAADIKSNGLREPIILTPAGDILDGRNRLAACQLAGVEPRFETTDMPEDKWQAWVLSRNLVRRHLSTQQRAAIAAGIASAGRGGIQSNDRMPVAKVAEALKVSPETVHRIRAIERKAEPGLIDLVKANAITIGDAEKISGMIPVRQRELISAGIDAIKEAVRQARSRVPIVPAADSAKPRFSEQPARPIETPASVIPETFADMQPVEQEASRSTPQEPLGFRSRPADSQTAADVIDTLNDIADWFERFPTTDLSRAFGHKAADAAVCVNVLQTRLSSMRAQHEAYAGD